MAAERSGLRVLVVAQPARAATLAASLSEASGGRVSVAIAGPASDSDRNLHDLFLVDAAEAAARGATLVLPREVPSHVLASALLSAAAWWREEAALREERELLLDRLVASERTASL